jgi:uncharacterized protein YdaU (DUF1376 family)
MPMYWGNYLGDTGHLSTVQHGIYLLLIAHYWQHGGLPEDDRQLANIVRLTLEEWLDHRATIQAFFYSGWKHKRVDAELFRYDTLKAKRAAAGSKGGTVASINRFRRR